MVNVMTSRLIIALAVVSISAYGVVPLRAEAQGHGSGHAAGHSAADAHASAAGHAVTGGHGVVRGPVVGHTIQRTIAPHTFVRGDVHRSVLLTHGGVLLSYGYPYGYGYAYGYDPAYAYAFPNGRYVDSSYGAGYPAYYGGTAAYGRVRIVGAPRDAAVYIDGYYVGIVNDFDGVFQHLDLEPGPHQIEIRVAGFAPTVVDVNVRPGRTITYRPDIRP